MQRPSILTYWLGATGQSFRYDRTLLGHTGQWQPLGGEIKSSRIEWMSAYKIAEFPRPTSKRALKGWSPALFS
jgi:hypothetical protein